MAPSTGFGRFRLAVADWGVGDLRPAASGSDGALESAVMGVISTDARIAIGLAALLLAAAVAAAYLPARRATSIDPLVALRRE